MESNIERQLRKLKITEDAIEVKFAEVQTVEPEQEDGESTIITNEFTVKSKHRPHKDFTDAVKKLRKFGLEICGLDADSKEIGKWSIAQIKISGDLLLKQSRVVMLLAHEVKTGKLVSVGPTPQVTMYGESEYENADKMTPVIEAIVEEVWAYLNGKYASENQLALFPDKELQEA